MQRILISACLLGERVRWDAKGKALLDPRLSRWLLEGRLVKVCPEVSGGLCVPRPPAESVFGRIVTNEGVDVSAQFQAGAEHALELARTQGLRLALLKERSPSCGSREIYDGSFSGTLVPGEGTTTALLRSQGIEVFGESELDRLEERLRALD